MNSKNREPVIRRVLANEPLAKYVNEDATHIQNPTDEWVNTMKSTHKVKVGLSFFQKILIIIALLATVISLYAWKTI